MEECLLPSQRNVVEFRAGSRLGFNDAAVCFLELKASEFHKMACFSNNWCLTLILYTNFLLAMTTIILNIIIYRYLSIIRKSRLHTKSKRRSNVPQQHFSRRIWWHYGTINL